ncbi:MAG: HAD hydrolase-like protein [Lachnospiraceae bacterium]|nr:HAD hydrolase-like protein [Lachnospiraceae bacterium]
MFSYILFDLDGTISDPKQGICSCVQYALQSFGIEEPDLSKLEPFIGPPLRDSFMQFYGFSAEQAQVAVDKYRERFSVIGKYENTLYPGMKELLEDLCRAGAHLAIASSKPTVFVEDILNYFKIRQCFEIVVGSELDGTRDKKEEVVAEVLKQFGAIMTAEKANGSTADLSKVVMIGDRKFDIEGAKAAGTHHIGVAYGYALPGELREAGAEIIVQNVEGLRRVLLGYTPLSAGKAAMDVREAAEADGKAGEITQPADETKVGVSEITQPVDETKVRVGEAAGPLREATEPQSKNPGGPQSIFYGRPRPKASDADEFQQSMPQRSARQGVYSGNFDRYRQPAPESNLKKGLKAIGTCLLAMIVYLAVNVIVANLAVIPGIFLGNVYHSEESYSFWVNLGNAAGTIAGFAVCYGIWHKKMTIRATKPVDRLSLLPMAVLAASLAVGMNGFLSLVELYKYSPAFQEISEIQFDIPIWLGILSYGILAPLGEEVLFRGIVYGQLKRVSNAPVAIVTSGILFGLFHGNLVQFVYATVIGIALALVYEIYGGLFYPILFHGIANLFVYVMLDLTEFGGAFVMPLSCMVFLVMAVVSLALMLKWQSGKNR